MSDRPPSFDELAGGDDLSPEEAARLERVHNLLIEAGPPPELPPASSSKLGGRSLIRAPLLATQQAVTAPRGCAS